MNHNLIERAKHARSKARAFYSGYKVGAALLCEDGAIYEGFNIEADNSSVTLCAERVAVAHAMNYTQSRFLELAIVADGPYLITPCGICRQFLSEFRSLKIYMANLQGEVKESTIKDLLPMPFVRGKKQHVCSIEL